MRILSVSIGKAVVLFENPNGSKKILSAIDKHPVSTLTQADPIALKNLGLNGDEQADLSVHGGLEKAIYAYPSEHYAFWNELLTRETRKNVSLQHGAFGENLTVEGLNESDVFVGDIWHVGNAELVVVKLREPCFKFNFKMGYKGASKVMVQSAYSGWYLRVNKIGEIKAGDEIHVQAGRREISITDQNKLLNRKNQQKELWD